MMLSSLSPSVRSRPAAAPPASSASSLSAPGVTRRDRRPHLPRSSTIAQTATFSDITRAPPSLGPHPNSTPTYFTTATTHTHTTTSPTPTTSTPTPTIPHFQARCAGAMLGAMCGNVLGAPLQHDRHWMVTRRFPHGVKDFWRFDFQEQPTSYGHYTGDYSMLLASAQSLVAARTCDARGHAYFLAQISLVEEGQQQQLPEADQQQEQQGQQGQQGQATLEARNQQRGVVASEGQRERSLSPYARIVLAALRTSRKPLTSLPHLALKLLNVNTPRNSQIAGDRFEREPYGPSDSGAAARILPVALAYRDADAGVLEAAVQEACLFSHPHPAGIDGARVAAAAVAWLSKQSVAASGSDRLNSSSSSSSSRNGQASGTGPQQLLRHLQAVAQTDDMRQKLTLLQEQLFQVSRVTSWAQFYRGSDWARLTTTMTRLTYHGYATAGTEAVAVALLALVTSWAEPEQAVVVAASFGGSVPVTSQLTGGLVGALHGDAWIPARWLEALENGPEGGRDRVVALSRELAALHCDSVGGAAAETVAPPSERSQ